MTLTTEGQSLDQVRAELDSLDRHIVALLAQRGRLVSQAAALKTSLEEINSPARMEQTLAKVRLTSQAEGANPAAVQQIYRKILAVFNQLEQEEFRRLQRPTNVTPLRARQAEPR